MVSVVLLTVFSVSQLMPVYGRSSGVPYSNAGQYASTGKLNCFPEAVSWINGYSQFYWESHPKSGDEIKPSDKESSFTYGWNLPLDNAKEQIKDGLRYSINLEVFGQLLDGDAARIQVDFLVPQEGGIGYLTYEFYQEDIDLWQKMNISGYVPEDARAMKLRLGGIKATGFLTDSDCAIYYRNIEVYLTDDIPPAPKSVEYGERRELGTPEERRMKDYYGAGDDVYWDIEFNEPIFVNDPGYLAHVRGLGSIERSEFLNKQLKVKFPEEQLALSHVQYNSGKGMLQQFGELKLKFKYRNADGRDMTGYAYPVDKSRYNKETYGNDYSKQIKFRYAVRQGDEFQASDIYEMVLEGGVITDNAFNPMPNECRTISFASGSGSGAGNIYRTYTRDFKVETTAPVLLEINGKLPEGPIALNQQVPLYLKFSEPVYITIADEAFTQNNINKLQFEDYQRRGIFSTYDAELILNAQNRDWKGELNTARSGDPDAYYMGGNGTSMLEFQYSAWENSFDPLEITGSMYSDWKDKDGKSTERVSYGELYVMDAAGNKAPLLPKGGVKLSESKRYVADTEPPVITVDTREGEKDKGGFYVKIDVTDEVSGVDYDTLRFGLGYTNVPFGDIMRVSKSLAPGRWYHSHELSGMFGFDPDRTSNYRVFVYAKDKKGNMFYGPTHGYIGYGWTTDIKVTRTDIDIPSIETSKDMSVSLETSLWTSAKGRLYECTVKWVREDGVKSDCKGLWYCMTREAAAPEFSATSGIWRYKEGSKLSTWDDFEGDPRERNGYYYMHIIAADGERKPLGNTTVPQPLLFDFKAPQVTANTEMQADGSMRVMVYADDEFTPRKDIAVKYITGGSDWQQLPGNGEITIDKDDLKPNTYVTIMATDAHQNYTAPNFGPYGNAAPKLAAPYINLYRGTKYTNEDFAQLYIFSPVEEFSWSMDGSGWSGWIPLEKEYTSNGSEVRTPCVPLPDREGAITFYTKYRNAAGLESDAAASTVVRDVTPPTGKVKYSSYYGSDFFYTAELTDLSDNLCTPGDIKAIGYVPGYYREIISRGEPHYFVIEDAAGNKGEVEAYMAPVPVVIPPDDKGDKGGGGADPNPDASAPEITVTPDGSSNAPVKNISVKVTVTDDRYSISKILYAFSTDSDPAKIDGAGWTETGNGSTVSLSGVTGHYYLHVKAVNATGNTGIFISETYHMDNDAPIISINPDGAANKRTSISPQIRAEDDYSISELLYTFSDKSDPAEINQEAWTKITHKPGGNTVSLSGVTGHYYLHVKATDAAGNTAEKSSDSYNMVKEYTEPYAVFSGELEGVMTAYIVSPGPITVTKAVYGGITQDNPGYVFNFEYADGTSASIEGEFDGWTGMWPGFIGTVGISPDDKATAGDITVTISAPTDLDPEGRYGDYDRELEFRTDDYDEEGAINRGLISGEAGSIEILEGFIGTWNGDGYDIETDLAGELVTDELLENEELIIFSVKITVKENGLIIYHVDDGKYTIQIGHILEDSELADNVTAAMAGSRWAVYAPWTLLASANRYASAAGMLKAYKSLSGADIAPPSGQVDYTSANPRKGPVTASLKLSDDSGKKVTVTNNGGSGSYVFNTNGQLVFEFEDETGNKGRALAQVSTMSTAGPRVAVSYSTIYPTGEAVKVTMTPETGTVLKSGDVPAVQQNGSYTFSTAVNGSWEFTFANEDGIERTVSPSVENIDRVPPKLWLDYIFDVYKQTITAIVRSDEQITPAEGSTLSQVYPYTDKERYTLRALDAQGNGLAVTASAVYLDEPGAGDVKISYSTAELTSKPVKITLASDKVFAVLNNGGNKELTVPENGQYDFVIRDSLGKIKVLTAEVKNIVLEAPVITLGYPDYTEVNRRGSIDLMNFTAVDRIDGDVKSRVKITGTVNTLQPGIYTVTYSVKNSVGNEAVKLLTVKVRSDEEQTVRINGVEYEGEPLTLAASKLQVTAEGFSGQVGLKLAEGFRDDAYFKNGGTAASFDNIPVSRKGWLTLYVYDNERNNRLVHVLITDLGGEQ